MKLKSLKIKNFKNLNDKEIIFKEKTSVLLGSNGVGKTSVKEALYAALTGEFPDNCIKSGEDHTRIELTLDDGRAMSRVLNASSPNKNYVAGKSVTAKSLNEVLTSYSGLGKEATKIVASSEVVSAMNSAELGTFIMEYLPEELTIETVLDYIDSLTPEMETELRKSLPPAPIKFSMAKIKEVYDYFFEERKNIKKNIEIKKAKLVGSPEKPKGSLKETLKKLDEIIGKEAAAKSAITAIKLYETAVKTRNNALENLSKLKVEIDSIEAKKPNPAELDEIIKNKEQEERRKVSTETLINTIKKDIDVFENTLASLDKPVCPLSESLVCTTDKTAIKEELTELLEANKEGLTIQLKILTDTSKNIDGFNKAEREYRNNEKKYNQKIILNKQYESQKKAVPTLPCKPDKIDIEDTSVRKKLLERERQLFLDYELSLKEQKELDVLCDKLIVYNLLCDVLKPKGIVMTKVYAHYLSIFESECNDTAKKLKSDFQIKFIAENGIDYKVKTDATSDFKSYVALSSGEKLFTMFLIMDMLNTLSGFNILMFDDLDKLDATNFESLMDVIMSEDIQKKYDHIIICAVNHEDTAKTLSKYSDLDFII